MFERAVAAQADFNALYWRVRQTPAFLSDTLREVSQADPFVQRLLDLLAIAQTAAPLAAHAPVVHLAVHRADYMLHAPAAPTAEPVELQQVCRNRLTH